MSYEADLCERMRNVTDNIIKVDLVPTLIRSREKPLERIRDFEQIYTTDGLYLLSDSYNGIMGSIINTNFIIYKPKSDQPPKTYILDLTLHVMIKSDYITVKRDVVKFEYTKEPKPETLINWIKDNVFTFIYNLKDNPFLNKEYFNNLRNIFRNREGRYRDMMRSYSKIIVHPFILK